MGKNTKIPALRFKGFEEEWEEKKLGEVGSVVMNKRIFKHQTHEVGEIPFFKIGTFGGIPDSYISREIFEEYKLKYPYPQKGDILLSASGSIGRTVEYSGQDEYFQDSNIVWLKHNDSLSNIFLKYYYEIVKWNGLEGSTIKRLYNSNILSTKITLPSPNEQTQIGNYFKDLDELIRLQEQKLQQQSQLKKAMLQKMFPQDGADTPQIRFKGFTDAWEKKTLGEIFDFNIPTNTFSRALLNDVEGEIKNVHYGDILIKYSSCLNVQEEAIPYITSKKLIDLKSALLKNGDVVFADAAEDEAVGKAIEICNLENNNLVAGLHTIVARPLLKFAKYFVGYYLNAPSYHNQLIAYMQGTKVLSISKANLKRTFLCGPTLEEQQKIGAYFQNLDQLISQSQQGIRHLKNLKQALLQKMFI